MMGLYIIIWNARCWCFPPEWGMMNLITLGKIQAAHTYVYIEFVLFLEIGAWPIASLLCALPASCTRACEGE